MLGAMVRSVENTTLTCIFSLRPKKYKKQKQIIAYLRFIKESTDCKKWMVKKGISEIVAARISLVVIFL